MRNDKNRPCDRNSVKIVLSLNSVLISNDSKTNCNVWCMTCYRKITKCPLFVITMSTLNVSVVVLFFRRVVHSAAVTEKKDQIKKLSVGIACLRDDIANPAKVELLMLRTPIFAFRLQHPGSRTAEKEISWYVFLSLINNDSLTLITSIC